MNEKDWYNYALTMFIIGAIGVVGGLIIEPIMHLITLRPQNFIWSLVDILYQVIKITTALLILLEMTIFRDPN